MERTLGVLWDIEADAFTYTTKKSNRPMTRRGLLGTVCSVCDPLGLVSPFVIKGKKLILDLAKDKVALDEPLEEELLSKWQEWFGVIWRIFPTLDLTDASSQRALEVLSEQRFCRRFNSGVWVCEISASCE